MTASLRYRAAALAAVGLLSLPATSAHAEPDAGALDTTFGASGTRVTDFRGTADKAVAAAALPDGRIVASGWSVTPGTNGQGDMALALYTRDGSLDTSFDGDGRLVVDAGGPDDAATGLAATPDGRIVFGGLSTSGGDTINLVVYRRLASGAPDTAFGGGDGRAELPLLVGFTGGDAHDAGLRLALSADGSITAGVTLNAVLHLVRLEADGVPDTAFGGGDGHATRGQAYVFTSSLAVLPDGAVLVGGEPTSDGWNSGESGFNVWKFDAAGGFAGAFSRAFADEPVRGPRQLALQPDGRVLAVGTVDRDESFGVARYLPGGALDSSFGAAGVVRIDFVAPGYITYDRGDAVLVQADGRIVVAGQGEGLWLGVARLNPDGSVDQTFGSHGRAIVRPSSGDFQGAYAMVAQGADRIVVVGHINNATGDFRVARIRAGDVSGYTMLGADGRVYPFGDLRSYGAAGPPAGGARWVRFEPTPSGRGYWVVDDVGGVRPYGDAGGFGGLDAAQLRPGERVTSLSSTPDGGGYWLFTSTGRVFTRGNAQAFGDMAAFTLNGPVLGSVATPSGKGYFMVASDGGIFAFGDARFRGSMGGRVLNGPVVGLSPDPDGLGYWLVASDGGVFAFDAGFRGSMGGKPLNRPVIGMVPYGNGYVMVASDGGIFNFSDKPFYGSLGSNPPASPIVSVGAIGG